MIEKPRIPVVCDKCGIDEWHEMTALAGGGWDTRELKRMLERGGWRVYDDGCCGCPECVKEEQEDTDG